MTDTRTNKTVDQLTRDDVLRVYSGRPGCMCGCLGAYRCTAARRELAGAQRGYPMDDDEVNDRQVTRVLNTVRRAWAADPTQVEVVDGYAYVRTSDVRCYCVYVVPGVRLVEEQFSAGEEG